MNTTMDCDLFKQSYYYTQPDPQGEKDNDDLTWLIHPVIPASLDPKEQVGETTEVVPEVIASPLQPTPVLSDEHPEIQEDVISKTSQTCANNHDNVGNDNPITRHELPPRSTRGFPPKRYALEFEAQRSTYPISKEGNDNLSQTSMAFTTSLYSKHVPENVDEALRDPK